MMHVQLSISSKDSLFMGSVRHGWNLLAAYENFYIENMIRTKTYIANLLNITYLFIVHDDSGNVKTLSFGLTC